MFQFMVQFIELEYLYKTRIIKGGVYRFYDEFHEVQIPFVSWLSSVFINFKVHLLQLL